jgi:hypothetical protein
MNREAQDGEWLACSECGADWLLTEGNREFLVKGLHIPKRCPECRRGKKAAQGAGQAGRLTRYNDRYTLDRP